MIELLELLLAIIFASALCSHKQVADSAEQPLVVLELAASLHVCSTST